jgi:hypothetical protein
MLERCSIKIPVSKGNRGNKKQYTYIYIVKSIYVKFMAIK